MIITDCSIRPEHQNIVNLQGGIHVMLFSFFFSFKAADQGGGDGGVGGSTKQVVAKWQAAAP